jgi:hypothetical protein
MTMKQLIYLTTAALTKVLLSPHAAIADANDCAQVISKGIISTDHINQSVSTQNGYTSWLCSTEFQTHQEAHNAGISIGTLVYNIPLQIGGMFDSNLRNLWKRDHCQASSGASTYSESYSRVLSQISDIPVRAWLECIKTSPKSGLSGVPKPRGTTSVSFIVQWIQTDYLDTISPEVTGYSISGGRIITQGSSLLKKGSKILPTTTTIDVERTNSDTPVVLTINTNRGSIPMYAPPIKLKIRLEVEIKPTAEVYEYKEGTMENMYWHTPYDDCVRRVDIDRSYSPPAGYSLADVKGPFETTKNGTRTNWRGPLHENGIIWIRGFVQGDDSWGFCKRSGWLGLKIQVNGERWNKQPLQTFAQSIQGAPGQTSFVVPYPYLISGRIRKVAFSYSVSVYKQYGDDENRIQLSESQPSADGAAISINEDGKLSIKIAP